MSSKDLFERLESARGAPTRPAVARPAAPAPGPEPKAAGETRRLGSNVVRRRADAPVAAPLPPPAPPVRTVIRRPGAVVEARPVAAAPPASALRRPVVPAPLDVPAPPAVAAPEPEPAAAAVEPASAAPSEPAVESVAATTVAPSLEAAPAAPAAAEPVVAESVDGQVDEGAVVEPTPPPVGAPPRPNERAGAVSASGRVGGLGPAGRANVGLNSRPILPGLGLGVVSLPVGYDPTDPTGARRRAREQAVAQPRWPGSGPSALRNPAGPRPAPGAPGETPAPAADDRFKKGARRGGRSEHMGMQIPEMRHRKHRAGGRTPDPRPASTIKRKVQVDGEITVAAFAHELGVKAAELIKVLMGLGQVATVNQSIDYDTAEIVAQELGHEVVNTAFQESAHLIQHAPDDDTDRVARPPVVTVMGHVDHGKTTLLDFIRKAKVASGEAGGITQHIGAYQVRRGDKSVTFIDTPGHSAFSAMRARGARVTDIVILVVAADDGVMPQTIEAINHAKAARVPIIVAINKIDKPGIKTDRIKTELMNHGLVSEEYGGDVICCPISALKGTGIDHLLDSVLLVAEVADLKANAIRPAAGVVIESRIETGRGAVASLLVKTGTLRQGDTLVIGTTWGRVRAMSDERGARVKEAPPSTPVEIFGLDDVPNAGDEFAVVGSERDARTLSEHRAAAARQSNMGQRQRLTVDDLFKQAGAAGVVAQETLHVVLKADVGGSLEALKASLEAIAVAGAQLKILHAAIGPVNESDVNLGAANGALVIAFNVKADSKARQAADSVGVEIKRYDIIYQAIDEVKARLTGMLPTVYEEQRVGEAEVRAVFNVSKSGPIAGCMLLSGKAQRGAIGKVLRAGKVAYEGKLTGLKRFKEDVKEVVEGFECGMQLEGYDDIQVGDRIELLVKVVVPPKT
ncbi:MAG: translation initiation factor IF-2 [Myxococcales bacterium]|nr:translation initiation factor IF-2 [Myxococcales bacterium]